MLTFVCFSIAKHFDRDPETNEVLWFAAPPVDIVHPPGPRYSLAYLHFLARKHQARQQSKPAPDAMDVDSEADLAPDGAPPRKRARNGVAAPTMHERIDAILAEAGVAVDLARSSEPVSLT